MAGRRARGRARSTGVAPGALSTGVESEELEGVAVRPVALDGPGTVVAAPDGGPQHLHAGGWIPCSEGAGAEVVDCRVDQCEAVHGGFGERDVDVFDGQEELGGAGWRCGPGQVRGEIVAADVLRAALQRKGVAVAEALAGEGHQLGALEVGQVPRRVGLACPAVVQESAEQGHRVASTVSMTSAVVAVSPSLGKTRSMLWRCASASGSLMASVARTTW